MINNEPDAPESLPLATGGSADETPMIAEPDEPQQSPAPSSALPLATGGSTTGTPEIRAIQDLARPPRVTPDEAESRVLQQAFCADCGGEIELLQNGQWRHEWSPQMRSTAYHPAVGS